MRSPRTGASIGALAVVALGSFVAARALAQERRKKDQAPPRLDARGDPLPPNAVGRLGSARFRNARPETLAALAFSSDGKTIVGLDERSGAAVSLWDRATGKLLRTLAPADRDFRGEALSAEGRVVVGRGNNDALVVYSVERGAEIATVASGCDPTFPTVAVSADGTRVASSGNAGVVRIFDASSGTLLRTIDPHAGRVGSVTLSASGTRLAVELADKDEREGKVLVFEASSGEALGTFAFQPESLVAKHVAFTPDEKALVVLESSGVGAHDVATGQPVWTFSSPREDGFLTALLVPEGGSSAFLASENALVELDLATGKELRRIALHARVQSLAASSDGKALALGVDASVELLDRATLAPLAPANVELWVEALAFSRDGKLLASAATDLLRGKVVTVWDVAKQEALERFFVAPLRRDDEGATLTPEEKKLLEKIRERSPEAARALEEIARGEGDRMIVSALAFSPDASRLAIGLADGTVRVHDRAKGEVVDIRQGWLVGDGVVVGDDGARFLLTDLFANARVGAIDHGADEKGFGLVLSPDRKLFARVSGKEILVGTVATGNVDARLPVSRYGRAELLFAPAGKMLAVADPDTNTVQLWGVEAAKAPLRVIEDPRFPGAFAPDGRTLATQGGTWKVATGKNVGDIASMPVGDTSPLAYSPDGTLLAAPGVDGEILLHDAFALDGRTPLDRALARYVHAHGRVDYAAWRKDPDALAALDATLADLAALAPGSLRGGRPRDRLARLLNAANALMLRAILAAPGCEVREGRVVAAGKDLARDVQFPVAGEERSFADLEAAIRAEGVPRALVALADGVDGRGSLRAELYTGSSLDQELEEETARVLADPTRVAFDPAKNVLRLSPLFRDRVDDFGGSEAAVLAWIELHAPDPRVRDALASPGLRVEYFPAGGLNERRP